MGKRDKKSQRDGVNQVSSVTEIPPHVMATLRRQWEDELHQLAAGEVDTAERFIAVGSMRGSYSRWDGKTMTEVVREQAANQGKHGSMINRPIEVVELVVTRRVIVRPAVVIYETAMDETVDAEGQPFDPMDRIVDRTTSELSEAELPLAPPVDGAPPHLTVIPTTRFSS